MSVRRLFCSQWPIVTVVLIFVLAFMLAAANFWRRGALLIGIGVGIAALLRLTLTDDHAGLLMVRSRELTSLRCRSWRRRWSTSPPRSTRWGHVNLAWPYGVGTPGSAGIFGTLPLAIDVTIDGQYIDIAMLVNIPAMVGDMPLLPAMLDAAEANVPPGRASIGQTDWPIWTAPPGSPYLTPALFRALRKASSFEFASTGADNAVATAIRQPAPTSTRTIIG